ncbi:Putative glycoside hydrolase, family 3, glycoside hydrolase family 3 domain, immunoglobulin [Septoria linicola]|uniref:beta-glucosidase n=1 Tax=Septoria linicola TaxID=215465 RepID=A0A9Q9B194_9PEZI|nr:Putative glycoside hydrolase, family 3, glycoside hydrolase family 3 domain, immunoglobulin [Septoria linicola]
MAAKYKDFDVEDVLSQLTTQEKVSLLSGTDFWHLAGVSRLGIPAIRTSDGPNGVRGTKFFNGVPAACLPCGTALGATWDVDLVREGGELMGREAIAKGASVLLGPTVNMQRSPLGGRGFESYSEDPVLAGNLAAASVAGIQSTGVAATLKHFVCNDLEDKRMSSNSIVSQRALREVYLMPFQIAQRDAKPWAYMTSYNLVNGTHASENPKLLQDILRSEWGFDGLVMSDWFGVYSTTEAIKAGLDLEMPGPPSLRGPQIDLALRCGKLLSHHLDARVTEVLKLIKKLLPLNIEENAEESTVDSPETAALLRSIAANSIVLNKNEGGILPFKKEKTTAVIGPNAAYAAFSGGGSASLLPYYAVTPADGIKAKVESAEYALGASAWKRLPLLSRVSKTKDNRTGLIMKVYLEPPNTGKERHAIDELLIKDTSILLFDYKNPQLNTHLFYSDIDTTFTPDETAEYEFSCSVAGTAQVFVDGKLVVDNKTKQTPGDSFFGVGTHEEIGSINLEAGKTYDVHVEFGSLPTLTYKKEGVTAFGAGGIRLGLHRKLDQKIEMQRAVELAKKVDQVVLVAGLNSDWESEGYDRSHMDLPPGSDELIEAVLAANPNTAVVIQSGTPVTMPWADKANALVQAWYGGNETGNAIADVVFGDINPSGKLSLSFPKRNEDNPAFLNYTSDDNRVVYGEGVYVGYKFYEKTKKEVLFPFGHGLSYTSFELKDLQVSADAESDEVVITVQVTNTGKVAGAEVVQVYVAPQTPSINRPSKELKGFAKVFVEAGETKSAEVKISKKYATSFYHEGKDAWLSEKGRYTVLVGNSSASTPLSGEIEVQKNLVWKGL